MDVNVDGDVVTWNNENSMPLNVTPPKQEFRQG